MYTLANSGGVGSGPLEATVNVAASGVVAVLMAFIFVGPGCQYRIVRVGKARQNKGAYLL